MGKYEHIFNNAPISIWEENWEDTRILMNSIRETVSSNDFTSYLDNNPDFFKKLIDSIKITRVNAKTVEIFKAKNEKDFYDKSISNFFAPKSYKTLKRILNALYQGEKEFKTETQLKTLNDKNIDILLEIKFPTSDYSTIVVAILDLTEQKNLHKKFQETKTQFNNSFYNGIVGMALINTQGEIIKVNDSFCDIFGYTQEEIKGELINVIDGSNNEQIGSDIGNLLIKNIFTLKGERLLAQKNGEKTWCFLGMTMAEDINEDPLYIVCQFIDINEPKEKAIKSISNVEKYSQLLKSTNTIYLILNPNGYIKEYSEDFTILMSNSTKENFHNKSLRSFVSTETIPSFDNAWKAMQQGKTITGVEIALCHKNKCQWVSMNASTLLNGASKTFVLLTDISEKKLEERKKRIAKEKYKDKLRNDINNLRQTINKIQKKQENENSFIAIDAKTNEVEPC